MEKVGEVKLRVDDEPGGAFQFLQGLETVAIGIDGKRALWQGLAVGAEQNPALRGMDYDRLIERAVAQRARVEVLRLGAARSVLGQVES